MITSREKFEARFLLFALFVFAFSFAYFSIQSSDVLMYLAFARDFWATGRWPTVDPYLYSLPNAELHVAHEYLSYLIFYQAYQWFGWGGLIGLKILILALGWFAVLRAKSKAGALSLGFMALWSLAVLAGSFRFIERSSAFSDLFCLISVSWLLSARTINRTLILRLSLLFLLWVQLHPGFPIGILLLGTWGLWRWWSDKGFRNARVLWLLLPPALLFLNPSGADAVFYPFRFALNEAQVLKQWNLEWLPTYHKVFRFTPESLAFWALLLGCLAIFVRAKKLFTWRALLASIVVYFGVTAVRFVPWASFTLILLTPTPEVQSSALAKRLRLAFAILLLAVAFKNFSVGYHASSGDRRPRAELDPNLFPIKTEEFWRSHRIDGRLYNSHDFGAYLIWMQDTPIFHHGFVTDMKFYQEEVVGALNSPERFFELVKKYNWTMLLVDKHQSYRYFYSVLSPHPEWQIVAEDDASYLIYYLPKKD